jgi:hypothetical protein
VSLQRFQLDVAARLESAALFACIPVYVYRARSALTAAQIQDQINATLGALATQNGKAGLCATVLMPLLDTPSQELPGPYLHLKCAIRVQENVMVNMGVNGTQIPCEDAAIAVAQLLHLWAPGGTAGILRAATDTITPNSAFEGRVTYDVIIESDLELALLDKTAMPFIAASGPEIAITCTDPDAVIYYTTDGSAPWAGNEYYSCTASLYSGPFATPAAGTLIRAAAFNPALAGSDINFLQL